MASPAPVPEGCAGRAGSRSSLVPPRLVVLAVLAAAGVLAAGLRMLAPGEAPGAPSARVADLLGPSGSDAGYERVTGQRPVSFPDDEGPHPSYRSEWWYYTGNLAVPEGRRGAGRRFGFELTFFRSALAPTPTARTSAWATNQVYMAHFALTDVDAGRFGYGERLARGAVGLAGASGRPFRVWLDDWFAAGDGGAPSAGPPGSVRLRAVDDDRAIDVALAPAKPAVLHGEAGYSRKGPEPGNASIYYSYTRLSATGTVTTPTGAYPVAGLAWMDHEWSTSALSRGEVGWDWFALQLDDGREVMLYRIRRADGSSSDASSGSVVDAGGTVTRLGRDDASITATGSWRSPHSGVSYPSGWGVRVPGAGLALDVEPLVADQELNVALRYWEGAVRVTGTASGLPVTGYGYVELAGYE